MIVITTAADGFIIDGVLMPKDVFVPINLDNFRINLINKYDSNFRLFEEKTPFDEVEVDSVVYGTLNELVTKLSEVL